MRKLVLYATIVAGSCFTSWCPREASAQVPAPSVAIVDMTYIFEHHDGFTMLRDSLKADAKKAEDQLKAERDALRAKVGELETLNPGTPQFKQLEAQIAEQEAKLKVKVTLQQKDFMQREAKIYYQVYTEIIDEVRMHAQSAGISLVLRFNGEPLDSPEPPEVVKQLNKPVVYYNQQIDITPHILERLKNRRPANVQRPQPQGVRR